MKEMSQKKFSLKTIVVRFLPRYSSAEIVRTRDPEVLKTCDIVVDVGGVFDRLEGVLMISLTVTQDDPPLRPPPEDVL